MLGYFFPALLFLAFSFLDFCNQCAQAGPAGPKQGIALVLRDVSPKAQIMQEKQNENAM